MKKLSVLVLSIILVLGFASASMAVTIQTSGEIDPEYFFGHWTGENTNYSLIEVGLYNNITINDNVSAVLNFWFESDQTQPQEYNILDDAYITYKVNDNSRFLIGKTRYWQLQGPIGDEFQPFFRGLLGSDDILEPPVSLIGEFKLNGNFNLAAGYFYNTTAKLYSDGYDDNKGFDIPFVKLSYVNGNFSADAEVLKLSKYEGWVTETPATDYMVDVSYKFGKVTAYAMYLGVAQGLDNNKISGYSYDDTDNFTIIGANASLGRLWVAVDYALDCPESSNWIEYQDGTWHETNWDEDHPYGITLSYWLGNNTTLQYEYTTNTGNWADRNRLRLIVKF